MTIQMAEMTREQIRVIAPKTVAVLPTASIEQHGPHLPILTDTILCGAVVEQAALRASETAPVVVAPVLCYGRSHHHRPCAGVLSLSSAAYMHALSDLLESLVLSGFKRIVVLNGHGGNSDPNAVVCTDFIQDPAHAISVAYASYWDIARDAIVSQGILPADEIPGHAGRFETSMVMVLRPDLVDEHGLAQTENRPVSEGRVTTSLAGGKAQVHGAWAAGPGYTDRPSLANAADGRKMLEITVREVAAFLRAFAGQF
jgi:creatinine amidohydrolase